MINIISFVFDMLIWAESLLFESASSFNSLSALPPKKAQAEKSISHEWQGENRAGRILSGWSKIFR